MERNRDGVNYEDLNIQQKTFVRRMRAAVEHAFDVAKALDDEKQSVIDTNKQKTQVLFGPPGTGKTKLLTQCMSVAIELFSETFSSRSPFFIEQPLWLLCTAWTNAAVSVLADAFHKIPN